MILYHEDWEKEGAFPDWDTKNKSFIDTVMLYKAMGIKNYAWPLALYDQSLKNIDPFDPDISPENAIRIGIECKMNPWYFFREICRDPQGSDEFPIHFIANRGILAAYWLFFNHITIVLIMIRQTGKSFGIDWLLVWLLNIGLTKAEINHLTKDEKLRGRGVERIKSMELTLPQYLKQRSAKDAGNTEVLRISSMGNAIKFHVPNRSPKLADLIGRGMTAGITVVDEWAYCSNNWITIPVMLSATLAAREVAKMKGEPYGTIFMTTSGKRDTPEGRYAYNFMQNAAVWSEPFFDAKNIEELEAMVLKAGNGKDLRVNCTFNHRQLGKTDQWLRDRLRESAQEDEVAIKADFLNEWPSGTMSSPFSQEVAQMMRDSEVLDYATRIEEPEPYLTRWYCKESEIESILATVNHVLAIDPSDAIGSDGIGITLRNVLDGSILMAADVSESNLIPFCRWLAGFLRKHPKVTLIIERRSTGAMILDFLLEYLPSVGIDPFKRIYNQVVQYKEEFPERFREAQHAMNSRENLYLKYKKYFGWATSGTGATSRTDLFSRTLTNATKMTGSLMKDRKLILQMLGLEVRNGRIDHAEGEHDDLCFVGRTLVRTIDGNRPVMELKIGDLVLTREGYKPITTIFINERDVITKYGITGTPTHPFITPSGEIPFKDLTLQTEVYTWNEKQSTIMVKTIIDTLTLKDLSIEIISLGMISGMNRLFHYIDKSTKIITDLFQKANRSIIKMVTFLITLLKISNVYRRLNIEGHIRRQKKLEKNLELTVREDSRLLNGEMKIQNSQKKHIEKMDEIAKESRTGVKTILMKLTQWLKKPESYQPKHEQKKELIHQSTLRNGVKITPNWLKKCQDKTGLKTLPWLPGKKIIPNWLEVNLINGGKIILKWLENTLEQQVKKEPKLELRKELVYNLTVADCHEYFVEDILVHNCISFLLSFWLMAQGKNLDYYGIDASKILTENPVYKKDLKETSAYERDVSSYARSEVERITSLLKDERDEFVAKRLEYDLELAISRLSDQDKKVVTTDDLINRLREERSRNMRRGTNYGTEQGYQGYASYATNDFENPYWN